VSAIVLPSAERIGADGDVVGMPEMLKTTSMVIGAGLGMDVACVTDGRFSGGTHGFTVGHVVPVRPSPSRLCVCTDDVSASRRRRREDPLDWSRMEMCVDSDPSQRRSPD
jgi:hypothetical protein